MSPGRRRTLWMFARSVRTYCCRATTADTIQAPIRMMVTTLISRGVKRSLVANSSSVNPARPSPTFHTTVSMNDFTCSLMFAGTGRYSS